MCIPFLLIIGLIIVLVVKNLLKNKFKKIGIALHNSILEAFSIYSDKVLESTTTETISEKEPSSKEFKDLLNEINKDLNDNFLIIVFDNMDRLSSPKVQELWSAIHAFFAEATYPKIRVIIPFDREHIKSAFKNEDIKIATDNSKGKVQCYGDDFINKTFNVVYRVSPPTMSNWKIYFNKQWEEAFGKILESDSRVTQIYDLLTSVQTPRKIIAFINEFVSIKQVSSTNDIPNEYIALFIFGKSKIAENPDEEILNPGYLGDLDFLYAKDDDLPKYISALYYQLPPEKALDIIYTNKLKRSMDAKDIETINQIQTLSSFEKLLENAIAKIVNISNSVLSLKDCSKVTLSNWKCLYRKIGDKREDELKEYQKVLLQKTTPNKEYLQSIISGFYNNTDFNVINYYQSIKQLGEISDIDPFLYLKEKVVVPEVFITFVEQAKSEYGKYLIICDNEKLNEYLINLSVEQLNNLTVIPYIKNKYKLSSYSEYLGRLIDKNLSDKNKVSIIYKRLKEIERPIRKKINDDQIYSLFNTCKEDDDFYFDLLCMRIARLKSLNTNYAPLYTSAMSRTDDAFVEKVAETLEYYMDYGTILINAENMKDFPLYKAVAVKITKKSYGDSQLKIFDVLQKYDSIINNLDADTEVLINRLNVLSKNAIKSISSDNVEFIPIQFFKDTKDIINNLVNHCKNVASEYLKSISQEDWEQLLLNENDKYQLLLLLGPKIQNCFDAFKNVLYKYAKNEIKGLSKDVCNNIISLSEKNKRSFVSTFKDVRDYFCSGQVTMTPELFNFIGEWLFKYSKLEDKKESLRTIFPSTILDNNDIIQMIIQHQDIMKKIVDNSEEDQDFNDKMQSLLDGKYKDKQTFIDFADRLGIHNATEK